MSKALSLLWRLYKIFLLLISFAIAEVLIFTLGKFGWEREFPFLSEQILKWSVLHCAAVYEVIAIFVFGLLFKYTAIDPLRGWCSARMIAMKKQKLLNKYWFIKGGKR